MTKIDFKKELKQFFQPSQKAFELVTVPPLQYLMIDGHGSPDALEYEQALTALYPVAYKLKFMSKKAFDRDYVVPPLQGLWWAVDMTAFIRGDKDAWDWTAMIMQPDWITAAMFADAVKQVEKSKAPPALSKMRLEQYDEGLSVQIMHIGSYADEAPTLRRLHEAFLPQNNLTEAGKHHEIYLSDPRRVAPAKLKTVLRQPVAPIT